MSGDEEQVVAARDQNRNSDAPELAETARQANIARRLRDAAHAFPFRRAIVAPAGTDAAGRRLYTQVTFHQLEEETNLIAARLRSLGLEPGMRMVLFVPFSIEFISLTFALFKAGAVIVLIDPGMGRTNVFRCLGEVEPDGFVGIPKVHLARWLYRKRFPNARLNICVGRRFPGVSATYQQLREPLPGGAPTNGTQRITGESIGIEHCEQDSPAAIIFTSGSTGPPKGVLYEHGMFDAQVDLIRDFYSIEAGEIDLPGFPLFGLFNAAMGVTTVIPDMDATRPADVDPVRIIEAAQDQGVTQAFGSPAFWNRVGRYCEEHDITLPSLKRALSAGGPVPPDVLRRVSRMLTRDAADLHTPYGATESLPVASIGAREVLSTTVARTRVGAGTCVGRTFPGINVRIIEIRDEPIAHISETVELKAGEIGEIIVQGPSVTREYFRQPDGTRFAKIPDPGSDLRFWHRIGDVGYFDEQGLLWFCGRKAHIVPTAAGPLYSVCCEAIFNEHPDVYRSALVGLTAASSTHAAKTDDDRQSSDRPHERRSLRVPAIVVEPEPGHMPTTPAERKKLVGELHELASHHSHTAQIETFFIHASLPVDTRHNVKINREALAEWAASQPRQ